MTPEDKYFQLYNRLLEEVAALHKSNQRRIRIGMRALLVVTVGLMVLMFLSNGNRVITLMLWIFSMFTLAAYLIAVEYADDELTKRLQEIMEMEQDLDLTPLTALPPKRPSRLAQRIRKTMEEKQSVEEESTSETEESAEEKWETEVPPETEELPAAHAAEEPESPEENSDEEVQP